MSETANQLIEILLDQLTDDELALVGLLWQEEIEFRLAQAQKAAAQASAYYTGLHHLFGRSPL